MTGSRSVLANEGQARTGGRDCQGARGHSEGDKCVLYLDSGEGFLDVCTCQSLLNCILLHMHCILCRSYLKKRREKEREREKLWERPAKSNEKKRIMRGAWSQGEARGSLTHPVGLHSTGGWSKRSFQKQWLAASQEHVLSVREGTRPSKLLGNRPAYQRGRGQQRPVHSKPCLALCFLSQSQAAFWWQSEALLPGAVAPCVGRGGMEGNLDLGSIMSLSCADHLVGRAASSHCDPGGYSRCSMAYGTHVQHQWRPLTPGPLTI